MRSIEHSGKKSRNGKNAETRIDMNSSKTADQ